MKKTTKKTKLNVYLVLDKSGSMSGLKDETIKSVNGYIKTLKKDKSDYNVCVTMFDTKVTTGESIDIKKFKDITEKEYNPDGYTALYDAVCITFKKFEKEKGNNMMVIITDGEENSSKEYTEKEFSEIVKGNEGKNWKFIYLGANQDAWGNASKWGFSQGNVSNYNSTTRGTQCAYQSVATATMNCAVNFSNSAFTDADKTMLNKTK